MILSLSLCVYFLIYNQYYSLTIGNLKDDAYIVHQYVEEIIGERNFSGLNTVADEQKEICIRTHKYNIIFMDIQMPEMDGLEVTKAIRALDCPAAKSSPIVAMTANTLLLTFSCVPDIIRLKANG